MKLDISGVKPFIGNLREFLSRAESAYTALMEEPGSDGDMRGWLLKNLDSGVGADELAEIKEHSVRLRESSDIVLVVGIGGSYLGARAVTELLPNNGKTLFVGNTLSGAYYDRVTRLLDGKDFSIAVISKSGTTTEPAVGFRCFEKLLTERYGFAAKDRVVAVTNPDGGALRKICKLKCYPALTIPDSVGGRYSVFSAAGLLPIAAAGIDADALLHGARHSAEANSALAIQYAAARQALYAAGKKIEVLAYWEPAFRWAGEWYKQLFGESEGKDGKGIFPASTEMTADLHSLGQYLQDGERNLFETFLWSEPRSSVTVPATTDDLDGFNHIAGMRLDELNRVALEAAKSAHMEGGVPAVEIGLEPISATTVGELFYFFMLSCAISGTIQGVNPFNQPGVEAYKRKMFALL
ncbi:MAG: glucose-6-phosphate isomerase [Oscillospiraceae bacterium]|jgi:glucose-6-phosphate isomerase|nr:glucose-6-phosphate isomerase [Oscillospiraceae bacterium]